MKEKEIFLNIFLKVQTSMGVQKKYSGPQKTSPVTNHYFLINEVIELNISDFRQYSCGSISPMFVKKIV